MRAVGAPTRATTTTTHTTRATRREMTTTTTTTRATRREMTTTTTTLCALTLMTSREQNLAHAADDGSSTTTTFDVETTAWTIARVPTYYEGPIDLGASASASAYACLLRDKRFGMAGETITLAEQTATSDGPRALGDIGDVDAVARRVVEGENAKSRGAAAAVVRETTTRRTAGVEYYGVEYEKTVLGVRRVVALTLALTVNANTGSSTLYTLTVERRAKDFDEHVDALRDVGRAFRVVQT